MVAGNQVLAATWAASRKHLHTSSSGAFTSLPVFDYVSGSTICNGAVLSPSSFSPSRHTVLTFFAPFCGRQGRTAKAQAR